MKKIVSIYVIEFLEDNSGFYNYQFVFRESNSTSYALLTLVERVSKALDMGTYVVGVCFDIKKAFDTVDHTIRLRKSKQYGI